MPLDQRLSQRRSNTRSGNSSCCRSNSSASHEGGGAPRSSSIVEKCHQPRDLNFSRLLHCQLSMNPAFVMAVRIQFFRLPAAEDMESHRASEFSFQWQTSSQITKSIRCPQDVATSEETMSMR